MFKHSMELFLIGQFVTHRQAEFDGVHRLVERPGELMLPQSLHYHILHVLQLVGLSDGHKHTSSISQISV